MNWATLKSTVAVWTGRRDLDALMPTFLELAEQRIYAGDDTMSVDQLRVLAMHTTVSPFAGPAIPDDSLQLERLTLISGTGSRSPIEFATTDRVSPLQGNGQTPRLYTIIGRSIIYGGTMPDTATVELIYSAKFSALAADDDTNWLSVNASAVYLHAMLAEAYGYLRNSDRRDQHLALWAKAQRAVLGQDDQDRHSGSPLRIVSAIRRA